MNNKGLKPVDLPVTEEEIKVNDKPVIKNKIIFNCKAKSNAALRIFNDDGSVKLYASERLGTLKKKADNYELDLKVSPEEITGKKYELMDVESNALLMTGVIVEKKPVAAKRLEDAAVDEKKKK